MSHVKRIRSVERALSILREVASREEGIGIQDLSHAVGLKVTTTASLVKTLVLSGYLAQRSRGDKYHLGNELIRLSARALSSLDIRRAARPAMERIFRQCNETVHLGILAHNVSTDIDVIESSRAVRLNISVGHQLPLHCSALGKVLIAWKSLDEVREILGEGPYPRMTPETITSLDRLWQELDEVRRTGLAFNRGESEDGVRCVSAPVRNHFGEVVAGLSISTPRERFTAGRVPKLIELVKQGAEAVSRELGYVAERLSG